MTTVPPRNGAMDVLTWLKMRECPLEHIQLAHYMNLEVRRIQNARIISPKGYEPMEVMTFWVTKRDYPYGDYDRTRGFVSKSRKYFEIARKGKPEDNRKFRVHTISADCKLEAFVAESIEMCSERDVIQIVNVQFNKAVLSVVLPKNELHGPIITNGPHGTIRFSSDNRRLLYFAKPNAKQLKTQSGKNRKFVVCTFDLDTEKVAVNTDENLCERTINMIEWTPDCRGIIFHRRRELVWHKFGESYYNQIMNEVPVPRRISFSPDGTRLAVFIGADFQCTRAVYLYHWPLVKAASMKHDAISIAPFNVWSVPDRPWGAGNQLLVFNINVNTDVRVCVLNVESLSLTTISLPRPGTVIDVRDDEMLMETVSGNTHSRLWISHLTESPDAHENANFLMEQPPRHQHVHTFGASEHSFDGDRYSAVLITPCETPGEMRPLVVIPHYGNAPNHTINDHKAYIKTLAHAGFFVLTVNYREPFVTLPGYDFPKTSGSADIQDVHEAVLAILSQYVNRIDPMDINLFGKRFGSFVACSLIVKYPKFYKRCALIRPMLEFPFKPEKKVVDIFPGGVQLKDVEPVNHAKSIKTPVFFLHDDSDGLFKYKKFEETLKRNNVPVFSEPGYWLHESYVANVIEFYKKPFRGIPQ
ncbi:unnamed protein product [Caenorhabditis sp. 36 PRJEB53466]|nr:unnamed protein product [Caenorhabditis sp. 36 PRJEB53466]